ncbi:MAG TPA: YdcF family protein [Dyella sp.]|uniref:YdcF family protein n=1 Tax=Dyella sp. TaxID=1869338 RepID=UPI002F95A891
MGFVEHIDRLLHPAVQSALLLVAGALLLQGRHYRLAVVSATVAMVWLGLCAAPAFANWLERGLEQRYTQREPRTYPTADAIVVLGGGKLPDDPAWRDDDADAPVTRMDFGLELFRQRRATVLLVSGADQASKMADRLTRRGVPAAALLVEDTSINTRENAVHSAILLRQKNLQSILLVTSGIHMPRAQASFARQGLNVIAAPTPDGYIGAANSWWPRRAALTVTAQCLREHLGLWVYRWRGWT